MEIKDKVVVITGGAQGIGFSIATYFAKQGAKLVLGDVAKEVLDKAVAELRKWFVKMNPRLNPGDTLLVFVTDHGQPNREDKA